jgi:sensor domain CHASE-containing protein
MIEVLLLSATFMIIILIVIMVIAFNIKTWVTRREVENQQRFDELTKRIDETQSLFRNQVTNILDNFKNLIK